MTACRQLLAALLVVVYLTVSTFGMAFVICFEGDGSQNLETVGADCCVSVSSLPAGDERPSLTSADDTDCGDCQDHIPAIDLEPTTVEETQSQLPTTVLLPPPALPALVSSAPFALERSAFCAHAPHPPPSAVLVCLRSVVLRC